MSASSSKAALTAAMFATPTPASSASVVASAVPSSSAQSSNESAADQRALEAEIFRLQELSGAPNASLTAADVLTADESKLGNNPGIELAWAEKAGKFAETHSKLLSAFSEKKKLKLTQLDDAIYTHFRSHFPASSFALHPLPESALKSESAKKKWRVFCESYAKEEKILDFNFGTLLRLNVQEEYGAENTIIVPRIQFFAIEIARNREGIYATDKKTEEQK